MQTTGSTTSGGAETPRNRVAVRAGLTLLIGLFAAFWIWALFFASKEAVNQVGDRAWAARAEQICATADEQRLELSDFRSIVDEDPELIRERADIIDRATDIIDTMITEVTAVEPTDEKGRAIVPLWADEYRDYIVARRGFADDLRATGENLAFYEPEVNGLPISERLETFAGDNEMPSCAPPRDLSR